MPFLPPNQQRQSTEGNSTEGNNRYKVLHKQNDLLKKERVGTVLVNRPVSGLCHHAHCLLAVNYFYTIH